MCIINSMYKMGFRNKLKAYRPIHPSPKMTEFEEYLRISIEKIIKIAFLIC